MIAANQAGPSPIHHKSLNENNLAEAIRYCLTPKAKNAAAAISRKMKAENGVRAASRSFHCNLPVEALRCDLLPDEPAVWLYTKTKKKEPLKLSDKAAFILTEKNKIEAQHFKLWVVLKKAPLTVRV